MITIVMIAHNVPVRPEVLTMTRIALETLAETADLEHQRVLVDNGSGDAGMMLGLLSEFLRVENRDYVITYPHNEAIAHCWNDAIMNYAMGDPILLLNNDVVFQKKGWMSVLVDALRPDGVGAAGSRLLSWNGHTFLEGSFLAFYKWAALQVAENGQIFDEQFQFTCEDLDLCVRLQKHGLALAVAPIEDLGLVKHLAHGTLAWATHDGWSVLDVMHESRRKFCRKYGLPERVDD